MGSAIPQPSQKSSRASTTSSISCTASVHSCTGTWAKVWKKVSFQKPAKTWQHWRKTTRRLELKRLRVKVKRRVTEMSSERYETRNTRDRCNCSCAPLRIDGTVI